jgi:hypothetical protein
VTQPIKYFRAISWAFSREVRRKRRSACRFSGLRGDSAAAELAQRRAVEAIHHHARRPKEYRDQDLAILSHCLHLLLGPYNRRRVLRAGIFGICGCCSDSISRVDERRDSRPNKNRYRQPEHRKAHSSHEGDSSMIRGRSRSSMETKVQQRCQDFFGRSEHRQECLCHTFVVGRRA